MEDTLKDQSSVSISGNKRGESAKLIRYPLRSATKSEDEKLLVSVWSTASMSRRSQSKSAVT
ncbi:hypothetical protein Hdeb2414_s0017g00501061 [Helianthus debilis subsp. tardiflorus]